MKNLLERSYDLLLGLADALEAQFKSVEEERERLVESVLARVGVGG